MSAPAADGWFRYDVAVRFRDLDPMGHAHHTLPLICLEEARAAFWRQVTGAASLDAIDYVMAEVTVRFHARIRYPSVVTVALALERVGGRSFTTLFELYDEARTLVSSGSAVQVAYDYERAASRPLAPPLRERLDAWREAYENSVASVAETMPITPPRT